MIFRTERKQLLISMEGALVDRPVTKVNVAGDTMVGVVLARFLGRSSHPHGEINLKGILADKDLE